MRFILIGASTGVQVVPLPEGRAVALPARGRLLPSLRTRELHAVAFLSAGIQTPPEMSSRDELLRWTEIGTDAVVVSFNRDFGRRDYLIHILLINFSIQNSCYFFMLNVVAF